MNRLLLLLSLFIGTNAAFAQYCTPTYGNQCTSGDYIDGFSLNLISNLGTACSNPSANNYTDYSASFVDTVQQGQMYTVTCSPGPSWGQYFAVWIDFNQDGDFDEVNEFFDIGYAAAGGSVATPITIPNGVLGGLTQMRVLCHFGTGAINQPDACAAQTWGECEDYGIVIGTPAAYEASTVSIDAPFSGCGLGVDTVKATFQNNGTNTIDTLVVCYSANSGPWFCDTLIGLGLVSTATMQHNFTDLLDLTVPNDYLIDVSVSLVGDTVSINDTVFGFLVQSIPTIASFPYFENFEAGTGGWVGSGTASSWEHGVASGLPNVFGNGGCASGDSLVWATGLSTPYNNNEFSVLESPCMDFSSLTSDPLMTFDHLFQIEGSFEDHWVEVSVDGGVTWTLLGASGSGLNWYNQAANWDGNSYNFPGNMRKAGHVLTGTAGSSSVRVRFVFTSDGSVQQEGIIIDNINIDAVVPLIDVVPTALVTPNSGCGLTANEFMTGDYSNIGQDTLIGFDVCYIVNGGTPVCETVTDTILPGGTYTHIFATAADMSAVGQYAIDLVISANDIDPCNDTVTFNLENKPVITSYPYLEKFENGSGGWTSENGANGTWELSTPAGAVINSAYSGANSWITNATGDYNVNENSWVESPCFDFTALDSGSWVAMGIWWEAENSWDGSNLQLTLDSGATWTNVGLFGDPNNWYNDNTINGSPGGSLEGWTGDVNNNGSSGWVIAKHELDDSLVGKTNVRFRITFGSDGSVTREGVAFDNFAIGTPPTINIGPDYVGCGNYEITPGLQGDYEWYTSDTSASPVTSLVGTDPTGVFTNSFFADTTYNGIVIFTDSLGLCGTDTALLTIYPTPYNVLNDTTICYYDSVTYAVDTSSRYTYSWNNGSALDSALYIYNTGGLVEVIVTDTVSGCADTTSANIYQTAAVVLLDTSVCAGDSILLDAGTNYSDYSWSTGDTINSGIYVGVAGQYSVSVVDSIGCASADTALLVVNTLPTPSISGGVDTICLNNDPIMLDAGSGFSTYMWSTSGTGQTETVTGNGLGAGVQVISVIVEDANGCANSDSITLVVDPCLGIEERAVIFNVYPNPSTGLFTYNIDGDFNSVKLSLTDATGRLIQVLDINSSTGVIDLSDMARGTYVLQIRSGESIKTLQLMKQ